MKHPSSPPSGWPFWPAFRSSPRPLPWSTSTRCRVGNAGNAADPATGYGAVGYAYRIAKNETTIGQYAEFLNAVAKTDTYATLQHRA